MSKKKKIKKKNQDPLELKAMRAEGSANILTEGTRKPIAIIILRFCPPAISTKSEAINCNKPRQITTFDWFLLKWGLMQDCIFQ